MVYYSEIAIPRSEASIVFGLNSDENMNKLHIFYMVKYIRNKLPKPAHWAIWVEARKGFSVY